MLIRVLLVIKFCNEKVVVMRVFVIFLVVIINYECRYSINFVSVIYSVVVIRWIEGFRIFYLDLDFVFYLV